jgi:hypothetical protein
MFMKKFIKVLGIVAILGSLGVASTSSIDTSKRKTEDITTVQWGCDALLRYLGVCRSSEVLPKD